MTDKRINLALIMGGQSSEHEVSLSSGLNILNGLDKNKYNVKIVKIGKDGKWLVSPYLNELPGNAKPELIEDSVKNLAPLNGNPALDKLEEEKVDVAFIAMHGKFGEDGRMQALLDFAGIPYQGSGVLASALAMDKIKSAEIYQHHGLLVPKYVAFSKNNFAQKKDKIENFLKNLPAVLKPSDGGSSRGTYIIKSQKDLEQKLPEAFEFSENLMLQQYVKGTELTSGVLDVDGKPQALPVTQIVPKTGEFFDYEAKYVVGTCDEITPAPQPPEVISEVQRIGLLAHQTLGCEGMSRTDVILSDGKYYVLETNTIPGMTATSLFPQQAAAAGISYSELLDKLIEQALNKK